MCYLFIYLFIYKAGVIGDLSWDLQLNLFQ